LPERKKIGVLAATAEHARYVADIHGALFEKAWDEESVRRLLEHPASIALVAIAEPDRQPIGFVMAQLTADEMEILSVGVLQTQQRHGVGGLLVSSLIETAQRREAKRVFLDVAESNTAARSLYARLGFSEMGRRKDYYNHVDGTREDALLMVREVLS
jgi:ribosomal-protein-alanine N-acetyltransferase